MKKLARNIIFFAGFSSLISAAYAGNFALGPKVGTLGVGAQGLLSLMNFYHLAVSSTVLNTVKSLIKITLVTAEN